MPVVIIGADVSGNITGGGQSRHIAVVIGTEESINKIYQKIGLAEIHMSSLSRSKRQNIFQELKFDNGDLLGMYLNVERQKTVDYIVCNAKLHPKNKPKFGIQKHFDYLLLQMIRDKIESFAFPRNCEIQDIVMQYDSDMILTGKNRGTGTVCGGQAYEIADAVAWCNERGQSIKRCLSIDLAAKLRTEMSDDLLK